MEDWDHEQASHLQAVPGPWEGMDAEEVWLHQAGLEAQAEFDMRSDSAEGPGEH